MRHDHTKKCLSIRIHYHCHYHIRIVPHKAVAEVSKIGNLIERWVVVIDGLQRELMDRKVVEALSLSISISLCLLLSVSLHLPSLSLSIFLSVQLAVWSWGADFEMCFASQWRAIFAHRNFQKWSKNEVLLVFWTSKSASCNHGVQFLIAYRFTWLCTRLFSELNYFSTLHSHKTYEKKKIRDFVHLSTHLDLPSTDSFSSASFISDSVSSDSSPTAPTTVAASVRRKLDL